MHIWHESTVRVDQKDTDIAQMSETEPHSMGVDAFDVTAVCGPSWRNDTMGHMQIWDVDFDQSARLIHCWDPSRLAVSASTCFGECSRVEYPRML